MLPCGACASVGTRRRTGMQSPLARRLGAGRCCLGALPGRIPAVRAGLGRQRGEPRSYAPWLRSRSIHPLWPLGGRWTSALLSTTSWSWWSTSCCLSGQPPEPQERRALQATQSTLSSVSSSSFIGRIDGRPARRPMRLSRPWRKGYMLFMRVRPRIRDLIGREFADHGTMLHSFNGSKADIPLMSALGGKRTLG